MDDDIVLDLRFHIGAVQDRWDIALYQRAADEIEQLRHIVDRLNAALDDITYLTEDRQVLHRIKEARRD